MDKDALHELPGFADNDCLPEVINKGGRPRIELTDEMYRQAAAMVRMHCTAEEVCDVLGISPDTLTARLKERGYSGFPDFYKRYSAQGKASLRRLQWRAAEGGNVAAMIWLGKQWLGQRDHARTELVGDAGAPLSQSQPMFAAAVMRALENKHGPDDDAREDGEAHDDTESDPG